MQPIKGVGGHLSVTGDREGTLTVTRESNDGKYSLVGDAARIVFEGSRRRSSRRSRGTGSSSSPSRRPARSRRASSTTRSASATPRSTATDLVDIRDGETVSVAGTFGVALTTVGESDLPEMGGSVTVGDETWEFDAAMLFAIPLPRLPARTTTT